MQRSCKHAVGNTKVSIQGGRLLGHTNNANGTWLHLPTMPSPLSPASRPKIVSPATTSPILHSGPPFYCPVSRSRRYHQYHTAIGLEHTRVHLQADPFNRSRTRAGLVFR